MNRILIGLLLAGIALGASAAEDSDTFRKLYEKEWAFRLQEYPRLASEMGAEVPAHRLTQVAQADQDRRYQYYVALESELDAVSCERLERQECINYRIFRNQVRQFIEDHENRTYLVPFNSDWGFYMSLARLPQETDFADFESYAVYLATLEELPAVMDQYIGLLREGLKVGMTQPRAVLDGRDAPIRAQVVDTVEESGFFQPFLEMPEVGDPEAREVLLEDARRVVMEGVVPAYRKLLTFFHEEYLPGARTTLGASALPNGKRFYQSQIRNYATVDLSPAEIHDIGLSEVKRIRTEMQEIIEEVGFEGSFADFIEFLRTDPQFYATTPKQLLAEASYVTKKVDGRLPQFFGRLPRQPYGVAPVPEDIAPFYTAGRYVGASQDALRGGYYWVNTYDLKSRPLYALPALSLHEAAPGHHLQSALALEQEEQPNFRRYDYISAYGEGWA